MTDLHIAAEPGLAPIVFQAFPKIARLRRHITITEKLDGTNAAVGITEDGRVYAQSRKRLITPEADNHGFARWSAANAAPLTDSLGPGLHFGEWWGNGIQRGYGLPNGDKRFSLFNTGRWDPEVVEGVVDGLYVVPVLYVGPFADGAVDDALDRLDEEGSVAAPGFMRPEGVVVYHRASNGLFKVTLEDDGVPKGQVA